jgi:hypothetical protein
VGGSLRLFKSLLYWLKKSFQRKKAKEREESNQRVNKNDMKIYLS